MKFDTDQKNLIRFNKLVEKTNRAIYKKLNTPIESELSPQKMAKKWIVLKEAIKIGSK